MRLDMIPFVNGTCEVDGVILIAVDTEDLFRTRLDLTDEVHQLPPV
jgi:hypothetical protein